MTLGPNLVQHISIQVDFPPVCNSLHDSAGPTTSRFCTNEDADWRRRHQRSLKVLKDCMRFGEGGATNNGIELTMALPVLRVAIVAA